MHCIVIKNFSVMYTHIIHNVDHHSSMLNITSRLAVRLRYLPDWDFDWSDNNAQQKRQSLELEDFLPDEEDGHHIHTRAVEYTIRGSPHSSQISHLLLHPSLWLQNLK